MSAGPHINGRHAAPNIKQHLALRNQRPAYDDEFACVIVLRYASPPENAQIVANR